MAERPATPLGIVELQADQCGQAGSPLYQRVLTAVAEDLRVGGVSAELLEGRDDPFGSVLALRLLGAVHRIVLEGRAPELAACYPSVGGDATVDDVGARFLDVLHDHHDEVDRRLADGVQTNEVGRSAVLAGGYAAILARTGLPLRVLEIGTSAGLNLRFDHFAYDTGRVVAGDPASPVRFEGVWEGDPPALPERFEVAERRGCDRDPIDVTTEDGRLTLFAYTWPDQLDRIARLEAAIAVALRVPVLLERADAAAWVEERLAETATGQATIVVHSIVFQYLASASRRRIRDALEGAGRTASATAPVHWLRMEPAGDRAELRLTSWPGGDEELLATAGFHGRPIWWQG